MRNNKKYQNIFIFLILICIYFTLISSRLVIPLQGDDITQLQPYGSLANVHPPLIYIILKILTRYFHLYGSQLWILGMFCFLINMQLVYLLVKRVTANNITALLGAGLFSLSPMAIQGSLSIDIDNTVLAVTITLFILYFAYHYEVLKIKHCLILGFLFFLALFSKFTTPLAFIPSLFIFYALKRKLLWVLPRIALIVIVGITLFLLVWQFFALYYRLPFTLIFVRPIIAFPEYGDFSQIKFMKHFIRISCWLGPMLLFIPLILIWRINRYLKHQRIELWDFFMIYMILVFLGYSLLIVQVHGFPKYLYPILPIFAAAIAVFLEDLKIKLNPRTLFVSIILILPILIYNLFIPGDIIYVFHRTLRYAFVFDSSNLKTTLLNISLPILSYPLFILLLYLILKNLNNNWQGLKSLSLALLLVGLSSNLSLNILQAKADYVTSYYYGRNIKDIYRVGEFLKMIKQKYPQGIIIGPRDVFRDECVLGSHPYQNIDVVRKPRAFLEAVLDKRVVCIAYSLSWNSISTYKNVILKPQIQKALKDNFRYYPIGEYSVWVRK